MKFDFVVIGATGIQGRIASMDLLQNGYSVLLCGRDKKRIEFILKKYKRTKFKYLELRNFNDIVKILKESGSKIVLNCAEGDWNLDVLKVCIRLGINYLDLGSEPPMTKEQFALNGKLKKKNLIAITGCGSTPGTNNIMLRYIAEKLDSIDTVDAGFAWNSNLNVFVVPFSIESIMQEFTDDAIVLEDGKFVKKKAQSYSTYKYFREIGRQRSFVVSWHPEPYTFYCYLKSKGLKNSKFFSSFPDHSYNKIMELIELDFGSKKTININERHIKKIEFLKEALKDLKIPKGYREKENLWVEITGKKNKHIHNIRMECIATTLKGLEWATCNVDTGMPASIIAQMVKKDIITEKGSFSPEMVVPPQPFFKELAKRKMYVYENGKRIN